MHYHLVDNLITLRTRAGERKEVAQGKRQSAPGTRLMSLVVSRHSNAHFRLAEIKRMHLPREPREVGASRLVLEFLHLSLTTSHTRTSLESVTAPVAIFFCEKGGRSQRGQPTSSEKRRKTDQRVASIIQFHRLPLSSPPLEQRACITTQPQPA